MLIAFSEEELCRALPPPGRYRAVIDAVAVEPQGLHPRAVDLRMRVLRSALTPGFMLVDRFVLRGPDRPPLAGIRRFLRLLQCVGLTVRADEPIELDNLIGVEVIVDVKAGVGEPGHPVSHIADYAAVAAINDPRATTRTTVQRERRGLPSR